jgi:hypothetical protein
MIVMMKGGMIMNKNMKKVLALSVIGMFVFMFAFQFVAAQAQTAGVQQTITSPQWFVSVIKWLGLGDTWALVIASVAVLIMIFAAVYEITGFSAFETTWVRVLIAAGVAIIAGVARGVTAVIAGLMSIVGGSAAAATVVALVLAIAFFIAGTFAKGRMKLFKAKQDTMKAKAGYVKAANAIGGLKDIDTAAARNKR